MTQAQGATKLRDHSLDDRHESAYSLRAEDRNRHASPSLRPDMELSSPRKRKHQHHIRPLPLVELRNGVMEVQLSAAGVATPSPLLRPPGAAPAYLSGKERLGGRVFIGRIILDLLDRSTKRSVLRRNAAGSCTYYFYPLAPSERPGVEHMHEALQVLQQRPC
jgi:hypothetical protein